MLTMFSDGTPRSCNFSMSIFSIVDLPERRIPVSTFTKGVSAYAMILSTYSGRGIIAVTPFKNITAKLMKKQKF